MSQTPLQDSPIFDQISEEFAAKGAVYNDLVNWTAPEFEWDPSRSVVQLDKQKTTGIKLAKVQPLAQAPLSESSKQMVEQVVKMDASAADFGRILQDYVSQVGKSFAEHYPLAIVTDSHTEMNADGSATVVFEAIQPITSVMPPSERNTAQPME